MTVPHFAVLMNDSQPMILPRNVANSLVHPCYRILLLSNTANTQQEVSTR